MTKLHFASLPFLAQFSALFSLFLGWVLFAELIIDRHGLAPYLPYYRIGNFCVYDAVVLAALGGLWIAMRRR